MRKKILLSVGLLMCVGVAVGIYLYQKPRTAAANQATDFKLSAAELYRQFEANETAANQKYAGKVLEVTGTVGQVAKTDTTLSILLTAPDAMGGINCSMAAADVAGAHQGQTVTVKGKCAGFLMDVNVLDAVLISEK
jgi:hypothetical protein